MIKILEYKLINTISIDLCKDTISRQTAVISIITSANFNVRDHQGATCTAGSTFEGATNNCLVRLEGTLGVPNDDLVFENTPYITTHGSVVD